MEWDAGHLYSIGPLCYRGRMLDVALKEWAVVCDLLLEGLQSILLRKGGIHEEQGSGRFRLTHNRFALFPAREHQHVDGMKPQFRARVDAMAGEPESFELRGVGEVAAIWPLPSRRVFDRLDDLHGWAGPQVDMRFNYKADRPLYLLAIRAFRLVEPKTITLKPHYWGCKSWVPLEPEDTVDDTDLVPAIDEAVFTAILERIESAMVQL